MSIGVLGFVVWSQWVAFLIGDYKVINSTVGWNGYLFLFLFVTSSICFTLVRLLYADTKLGNLLDTFYSLNANRNAQSAGNFSFILPSLPGSTDPPTGGGASRRLSFGWDQPKANKIEDEQGSSETIRGNTYDLFKENYMWFFKEKFKKDNDWLTWFIGFLEGDGAILEHKGRSSFVITQKDDTVLHEIYETLKIGIVKHFYDNNGNRKYSRYIVSENKGIFLLYLLLNGNLVLQSRVNQLTKWNIALNNASRFNFDLFYTREVPKLIEIVKQPNLKDGWLSGFTDAEGCFSVKIENRKKAYYVRLLFILDQKDGEKVLNQISSMLNANTKTKLRTVNKYILKLASKNHINYTNTMFRLSISCNDSKKIIVSTILDYFNKYPLKTSKSKSFQVWTDISKIILGKQPLSSEDLKLVRKLRHNMNFFTIENLAKGYANRS